MDDYIHLKFESEWFLADPEKTYEEEYVSSMTPHEVLLGLLTLRITDPVPPECWDLVVKSSGKKLPFDEPLAKHGIKDGDTLIVVPNLERPRREFPDI